MSSILSRNEFGYGLLRLCYLTVNSVFGRAGNSYQHKTANFTTVNPNISKISLLKHGKPQIYIENKNVNLILILFAN